MEKSLNTRISSGIANEASKHGNNDDVIPKTVDVPTTNTPGYEIVSCDIKKSTFPSKKPPKTIKKQLKIRDYSKLNPPQRKSSKKMNGKRRGSFPFFSNQSSLTPVSKAQSSSKQFPNLREVESANRTNVADGKGTSKSSHYEQVAMATSSNFKRTGAILATALCFAVILTGVIVLAFVYKVKSDNKDDKEKSSEPWKDVLPPPALPNFPQNMNSKSFVSVWLPEIKWAKYAELTVEPLKFLIHLITKIDENPVKYKRLIDISDKAKLNSPKFLNSINDVSSAFGGTSFILLLEQLVECLNNKPPKGQTCEPAIKTLSDVVSKQLISTNMTNFAAKDFVYQMNDFSSKALGEVEFLTEAKMLKAYSGGFSKLFEAISLVTQKIVKFVNEKILLLRSSVIDFEALAYLEVAETLLASVVKSYPRNDMQHLFSVDAHNADDLKKHIKTVYDELIKKFETSLQIGEIKRQTDRLKNL